MIFRPHTTPRRQKEAAVQAAPQSQHDFLFLDNRLHDLFFDYSLLSRRCRYFIYFPSLDIYHATAYFSYIRRKNAAYLLTSFFKISPYMLLYDEVDFRFSLYRITILLACALITAAYAANEIAKVMLGHILLIFLITRIASYNSNKLSFHFQ